MRVPFEGTDLSLIARSRTRGSTRVSGEVARENKGICRKIKNVASFPSVKQIEFCEITLFYVKSLEISSVRS